MSRSSSVWIVFNAQEEFSAAFTVKHEMLSWLHTRDADDGVVGWSVLRAPDNPSGLWQSHRRPERYPAEDLL